MRLIRFLAENKEKIGVLDEKKKRIIELYNIDNNRNDAMIDFIKGLTDERIEEINRIANTSTGKFKVENIKILAPIQKPVHDIICIGVNYKKHLDETKKNFDTEFKEGKKTVFFSKRANKIIGTEEKVKFHYEIDIKLDYEVELAVIIGREGKNIPEEKAEEYIFGYSIFNDFSSRKLQKEHNQWFKGKSLDTYSAMGPIIVTKDELKFPIELDISSEINGELRQNSNTKFFLTNIGKIISEFSKGITLEVGDIIITGTPEGVGMGFQPPKFLKKGDIVKCRIEKIGELVNYVE